MTQLSDLGKPMFERMGLKLRAFTMEDWVQLEKWFKDEPIRHGIDPKFVWEAMEKITIFNTALDQVDRAIHILWMANRRDGNLTEAQITEKLNFGDWPAIVDVVKEVLGQNPTPTTGEK